MLYTGDINQMHNNNVNTSESQNKQKTCRFTDCENEPIIDPHQSTKYCDQHSCDYIINKVNDSRCYNECVSGSIPTCEVHTCDELNCVKPVSHKCYKKNDFNNFKLFCKDHCNNYDIVKNLRDVISFIIVFLSVILTYGFVFVYNK